MAVPSRPKNRRKPQKHTLHKPLGVVHPRVQAVGPEHFGIVSVDCAKARSKWMLADFYGQVLVPRPSSSTTRPASRPPSRPLREAIGPAPTSTTSIVAVERTGRYHRPVQRAFAAAGFEVRIVHPFATKQFRQPADPGNKTDDTDLAAIHRAAVNGFGLLGARTRSGLTSGSSSLARHRRDLVDKARRPPQPDPSNIFNRSCQDTRHASTISSTASIALWIARELGSAAAILAGRRGRPDRRLRRGRHAAPPARPWRRSSPGPRGRPAAEEPATLHHRIFARAG